MLDRLRISAAALLVPASTASTSKSSAAPTLAPLVEPESPTKIVMQTLAAQQAVQASDRFTAMSNDSYSGASDISASMRHFLPGNKSANQAINPSRKRLMARSSALIRNSPIAAAAVNVETESVVGTGLTMQCQLDQKLLGLSDEEAAQWVNNFTRHWDLFTKKTWFDARLQTNFYRTQDLAYRSRFEFGDVFALLVRPDKGHPSPYGLALQLIESEHVCNPNGGVDTVKMQHGIELNDFGRPVAIHVAKYHPSEVLASKNSWERVDMYTKSGRQNVIRFMRSVRVGQVRGVPELAPVIDVIKQISRYTEASVTKAVNAAMLNLFITMDPKAFAESFSQQGQSKYIKAAESYDGSVDSSRFVNLLPGEDAKSVTMNAPDPEFDAFVNSLLKQVGASLGIPLEVLLRHFQSSYSAARGALLSAWKVFYSRRDWMADEFCQPIKEAFLEELVLSKRIEARGFFADPLIRAAWCGSKWNGDGPGSINPNDEADAMQKRLAMHVTTLEKETIQLDGSSWAENLEQRKREVDAIVKAGLLMEVPAGGSSAQLVQQNGTAT